MQAFIVLVFFFSCINRHTGSLVSGYRGKERHEGGAAEELGDEHGGVSLGLGAFYPPKAMS